MLILFENVPALDGWTVHEVAFLYACTCISFAFVDMVIGHLDLFPRMIREGTFDLVLVRPRGSLFQVIASDFAFRRLGRAFQGVVVFAYALTGLDIDWDPGRVAMVGVMLVAGALIFGAVWIAGATIAFWTVDGGEFTNAFTYGGNFLTQYPISIYGEWLRRLLAFVDADGVRLLLPVAVRARQGGPARAPARVPVRVAARGAARSGRRRRDLGLRRPPLPERRARERDRARGRPQALRRALEAGPVPPPPARGRTRSTGSRSRSQEGELLGYLGPNGAGKSTTIKMLTGILVPSSGEVRVAGLDPARRRIELTRKIGVVFGQRVQLWWDLPLRDSFDLLRHVYKVPRARYVENLARFTELLELEPFLGTPVRQLSLGQRVRGDLSAALLHDPEVVFLDEPTIGLDVIAKQRVRDFLVELNRERGVTVVLTTHDLGDIERLCSRLVVIDHGRVIWDGGIEELKRRHGRERTLVVDLEEPAPPLSVPGAEVVRVEGPRQWLSFRGDEVSAAELTAAVAARAPLVDLAIEETEIEEIVRADLRGRRRGVGVRSCQGRAIGADWRRGWARRRTSSSARCTGGTCRRATTSRPTSATSILATSSRWCGRASTGRIGSWCGESSRTSRTRRPTCSASWGSNAGTAWRWCCRRRPRPRPSSSASGSSAPSCSRCRCCTGTTRSGTASRTRPRSSW